MSDLDRGENVVQPTPEELDNQRFAALYDYEQKVEALAKSTEELTKTRDEITADIAAKKKDFEEYRVAEGKKWDGKVSEIREVLKDLINQGVALDKEIEKLTAKRNSIDLDFSAREDDLGQAIENLLAQKREAAEWARGLDERETDIDARGDEVEAREKAVEEQQAIRLERVAKAEKLVKDQCTHLEGLVAESKVQNKSVSEKIVLLDSKIAKLNDVKAQVDAAKSNKAVLDAKAAEIETKDKANKKWLAELEQFSADLTTIKAGMDKKERTLNLREQALRDAQTKVTP